VGELPTLALHAQWYLTLIAMIMDLFMISVLTITASIATDYLTKNLGENFIKYKEPVHLFLPKKSIHLQKGGFSRKILMFPLDQ